VQPTDTALLRLADPAARTALLTSDALLQIARASYAIDPAAVVGATSATFETFDLAVALPNRVTIGGHWSRATDPLPVEAGALVDGLIPPTPAADAVWAGSVVVRIGGGDGTVTEVQVARPDLNAALTSATAGLPANATGTQIAAAERGAARAALANPALTDHELDVVLLGMTGASDGSPRDLGPDGDRIPLGVRLAFSAPPAITAATTPIALPVVVAFLVGDATTSPRSLLQQSDAARRAAARYPVRVPPPGPTRSREQAVCWVLPDAAFDDDGWPGGTAGPPQQRRLARLGAARAWLLDQGIAVVTT
jgi:hypothetical protein